MKKTERINCLKSKNESLCIYLRFYLSHIKVNFMNFINFVNFIKGEVGRGVEGGVKGEVDNCLSNLKLNYRKQIVNLSQTYINCKLDDKNYKHKLFKIKNESTSSINCKNSSITSNCSGAMLSFNPFCIKQRVRFFYA